jgi:small subunit ribosomal protein S17
MTQTRPVPRALFGKVVSDKMQKTVVVEVVRIERHSLYGKVLRRKTKMKVHDEQGQCKIGDQVKIVYSRPISKDRCWRVAEICGKKSAA